MFLLGFRLPESHSLLKESSPNHANFSVFVALVSTNHWQGGTIKSGFFSRIVSVVVSLVVLGAHFLRDGNWALLSLAVLAIGLLAARKPWVVPAVQTFLVIGSLLWVKTLVVLAYQRQMLEEPVLRMALILAAVASFTAASAFLLSGRPMKIWYHVEVGE